MVVQEILEQQSIDDLKSIAQWYGLKPDRKTASAKETLVGFLQSKLQSYFGVLFALDRMTESARQLYLYLAASGGELLDVELIQEVFAGDRTKYEDAVAVLRAGALVWINEQELAQFGWKIISIPKDILQTIPIPFVLQGLIGKYLLSLPILKLQELCRQLGISSKVVQINYLVKKIRQQMVDPVFLRRYIDDLPKEEAAIFQFIFDIGGRITTESLDHHFSLSFNFKQGLRRLLDRPILIPDRYERVGNNYVIAALRIPREIITVVRNRFYGSYHFEAIKKNAVDEQPKVPIKLLPSLGANLDRNLLVILSYILRNRPVTLKKGGIEKRHLKKIASFIPDSKINYIQFLHSIAELTNLVRIGPKFWCVSNGCQAFLDNPFDFKIQLTDRWLDSSTAGKNLEAEKPNRVCLADNEDIPEIRFMILESLAGMAPGEWIPITMLKDIAIRRFNACKRIMETGDDLTQVRSFRRIIERSMKWLGLLELGSKEDETTTVNQYAEFVRLTALGRYLLFGWLDDEQPEVLNYLALTGMKQPLEFLPNGSIKAPDSYSPYLLLNLLSFANLEQAYPDIIFSLDRDSIRNGFDSGLDRDKMLKLLGGDTPNAVPNDLKKLIAACEKQYGEIIIGSGGGFIKTKNKETLNQIITDKKYESFIRKVISPSCAILVPQTNRDRMVELLRRDGMMPMLEDESVKKTNQEEFRVPLTPAQLSLLEKTIYVLKSMSEQAGQRELQQQFDPLYERLRKHSRRIGKEKAAPVKVETIEKLVHLLQGRSEPAAK